MTPLASRTPGSRPASPVSPERFRQGGGPTARASGRALVLGGLVWSLPGGLGAGSAGEQLGVRLEGAESRRQAVRAPEATGQR